MARAKPSQKARAGRAASPATMELFEAKLSSSGLTLDDAGILRIEPLDPASTSALHSSFKPLSGLLLSYLDPAKRPLPDWPAGEPFYRVRYLEVGSGFADLAEKKPPRYVQLPNTAPVAYYPANEDWEAIIGDPGIPIILTEGELKAAKACKEGFPTIGLGGVYNWRSNKLGLTWLPSLDFVAWLRRNVYICFDSDMSTNPLVLGALKELADALHQRGAFVYLVTLPQLEDLDKVGLDDFLVHAGTNAADQLHELLHQAEPLGLTGVLFELNQRYAYVRHPGLVFDQLTREKVSPGPFKEHLEATKRYQERQVNKDGSISYKAVSAAAAWLTWPLRHVVDRLTYAPGAGTYLDEGPEHRYNLWPGWGIAPKKGCIKRFLKLVDHLFTGADPGAKEWFLRWCAYPLQHPGTKMFSSVVIYGIKHGTGKSLIGYTLGRIYGKNFTEITQQDLHGTFNEWAECKQFVMGDDVTGSDKRQEADFLKKMITQKTLRVNMKFLPTYVVPDCINYYFTSNQPDAFFLEDDDRRFFIHEVLVGSLPMDFYVDYEQWLETGGAEAVFDYLLHLDLTDFNPSARAFETMAKARMIADGQSDLGSWVRGLLATPDAVLRIGEVKLRSDLYTSKELLALYDSEGRTKTTANGLGRELRRAGVVPILGGRPIKLPDGSQGRYYAVRNSDQWLTATTTDVLKHLSAATGKPTRGGGKY